MAGEVGDNQFPEEINYVQLASSLLTCKEGVDLDLTNRPYLWPIYNTSHKRLLLLGGRQIEKTTTLVARTVVDNVRIPYFKNLYITPLEDQSAKVSKTHFDDMVHSSPVLDAAINRINSVMEKRFKNQSTFDFSYAQFSADRIRGRTADRLIYDEIQDMSIDIFPIIMQVIKKSRFHYTIFSGTAKLEISPTQYFWTQSTACEWMVKCPHCGHYQDMRIENVGAMGPICSVPRCRMPLTIHDILDKHTSCWVATMDPGAEIAGFRINQLMNPEIVHNWKDFMFDFKLTMDVGGESAVQNEIFGVASGEGEIPFTEAMLKGLSDWIEPQEYNKMLGSQALRNNTFMGIDWGGEEAYTAVTIIGFPRYPKECVTLHHEVFDTIRTEEAQLRRIFQLINQFKCAKIIPDAGMGFDRNPKLISQFPGRVFPVYYSGNIRVFLTYDKKSATFTAHRSRAMSLAIKQIKEKTLRLPPWSMWGKWVSHYLSFRKTTLSKGTGADRLSYVLQPKKHDDLFHSLVFATIGYNVEIGNYLDLDDQPLKRPA